MVDKSLAANNLTDKNLPDKNPADHDTGPASHTLPGNDLAQAAYRLAWADCNRAPGFPDEKRAMSQQLRALIRREIERGENDAARVAAGALGALRQQTQLAQSTARVGRSHNAKGRPPETA